MPSPNYTLGQTQHAEGVPFEANPFPESEDEDPEREDWANGWRDSAAAAEVAASNETDTPPSDVKDDAPGEPGTSAPEGTPNAESAGDDGSSEGDAEGGASAPPTESAAGESPLDVVESLGDEGYDRIMDLLTDPPFADLPPGTLLPPEGDVPDDLYDWLEAWKQPLAFVAVDTAIGAVRSRLDGSARGRLRELYRGMDPQAMTAVMEANADAVAAFADQRVAEAGMIASIQTMVTQKAAGYLLTALTLI